MDEVAMENVVDNINIHDERLEVYQFSFKTFMSLFYLWNKCRSSRHYLETKLFCSICNTDKKKDWKLIGTHQPMVTLFVDQIKNVVYSCIILMMFSWSSNWNSSHNHNQDDHNRQKQWWSNFFLHLLLVSFFGILLIRRLK